MDDKAFSRVHLSRNLFHSIVNSKLIKLPKYLVVVSSFGLGEATLLTSEADQKPDVQVIAGSNSTDLPHLPRILPPPSKDGLIYLPDVQGRFVATNLIASLQADLARYIVAHGNPIASVVVAEVATGKIRAMTQGLDPAKWETGDSEVHTALYERFPAASIFKIVSTAAAIELAGLDEDLELRMNESCGKVNSRGSWLGDIKSGRFRTMSLAKAFANSCNTFYAKMSMSYLGLGSINAFAKKFGWGEPLATDFYLPPSPINPPSPSGSTVSTVGRYAAGFGFVGISAVHGAWLSLLIANNGSPRPMRLFATEYEPLAQVSTQETIGPNTAQALLQMMNGTVRTGTAASTFRRRPYREYRQDVGGKTGTLTGLAPSGLTTWFVGVAPTSKPEIVVSAVVVNGPTWVIKGTQLAAEAVRLWFEYRREQEKALSQRPSSIYPEKVVPTRKAL